MQKTFSSYNELLDFDFSELEPQTSNYLRIIPINGIFPKVKKEFELKKWKIVERHNASSPEILFEITPRWITITIHRMGGLVRRRDFPCLRKDPRAIIQAVFEP